MRIRRFAQAAALVAAFVITPALASAQNTVDSSLAGKIDAAITSARGGDLNGAASSLEKLVDMPSGGHLAAYNLGVIRERMGQLEAAEKAYMKALEVQSEFGAPLRNLTRMLIASGNVSKAQQTVGRFTNMRPNVLDHRATAIDIMLAKGQYEDAGREARRILREDEKHGWALLALAQAEYQAGRYELAAADRKSVV